MVDYVDRARMTTSGGSGTLTLTGAVTASQTFAAAGVANGDVLEFLIEDFPAWEISTGVYTSGASPTLTRTLRSSSSGSLLNVSTNGVVTLALTAASMRAAFNGIGRNLLVNSRFNVNQRAFSSTGGNGAYTLDHWQAITVNDPITVSAPTLADSDRAAIGDENALTALQIATTGQSTSGSYSGLRQWVEGVRRTAGKTLTVSLWAYANAACNLGFQALQYFGPSGGSAQVVAASGTFAIGTAWQRYSFTFTTPSLAGLTVAAGDAMICTFFASSFGVSGTGVGQQTATINIWGVQLEYGQTPTQLESLDPELDLLRCQRYFVWLKTAYPSGYGAANGTVSTTIALPSTMRTNPTITFGTLSYTNTTAVMSNASSPTSVQLSMTATAAGQAATQCDIFAAAEF